MYFRKTIIAILGSFLVQGARLPAAEDFEEAPVFYSKTEPKDPVAEIRRKLAAGEFEFDRSGGEQAYLRSVLRELKVPVDSQVLVFSRTSLQTDLIRPERPRAVYFSDEFYVGWVQGGDVELIACDPNLGPVFYRLHVPKTPERPSRIERDQDCLRCHAGLSRHRVPTLMFRSVYTDADGRPILSAGSFHTSHSSPLKQRWGGWYVTGDHGDMRHMGNVIAKETGNGGVEWDPEKGANLGSLKDLINVKPYLREGSDIVALMVLEHQVTVHNEIIAAHLNTRKILHRNRVMAKHFDYDADELSETSQRLLRNQAEELLRALLFKDEFMLQGYGIEGDPAFQKAFAADAKRTKAGRSLRELQLLSRLFKNRCSYMIYSSSFRSLPDEFRAMVLDRLRDILDGATGTAEFNYIGASERGRIREILEETLPEWTRIDSASDPSARR